MLIDTKHAIFFFLRLKNCDSSCHVFNRSYCLMPHSESKALELLKMSFFLFNPSVFSWLILLFSVEQTIMYSARRLKHSFNKVVAGTHNNVHTTKQKKQVFSTFKWREQRLESSKLFNLLIPSFCLSFLWL